MGRQNGLGYTRLTVSDDVNLKNKPITIMVGGKRLDEILEELEAAVKKGAERMLVADIESLTDSQCDALRCGDLVIESKRGEESCYQVAYTKDGSLLLVTCTAGYITQVGYDYSEEDGWTRSGTTTTDLIDSTTGK